MLTSSSQEQHTGPIFAKLYVMHFKGKRVKHWKYHNSPREHNFECKMDVFNLKFSLLLKAGHSSFFMNQALAEFPYIPKLKKKKNVGQCAPYWVMALWSLFALKSDIWAICLILISILLYSIMTLNDLLFYAKCWK